MTTPPKPCDMLQIRGEANASPALVEASVRMLSELLQATGEDANSPDFTIVVNNRVMSAQLRAWTDDSSEKLGRIQGVVENLYSADEDTDFKEAVATAIVKWAKKLRLDSHAFTMNRKRSEWQANLDQALLGTMDKFTSELRETEVARKSTVRVIESTVHGMEIMRAGKSRDGEWIAAKIRVDGKARKIRISHDKVSFIADAISSQSLVKMVVEAPLLRARDGSTDLDWDRARAVSIRTFRAVTGAEFVKATESIPDITKSTLLEIYGGMAEE